jgi:hypothetical protein
MFHLPKKWLNRMKVNAVSVYLRGNNLLTWKKLPYDPELSDGGDTNLGDVVEGRYPVLRRFTLGMQLGF